jgi:Transposase DDE domain group 1
LNFHAWKARLEGRAVVASFTGGRLTSDAGALLLGATDRVLGLTRRFAACFTDARHAPFVEHSVQTLVMQRVVGIALGYEDLIDHDELRHDPVLSVLAGKLAAGRSDCAPLAGKSTLNRLERSCPEPSRYARIAADPDAIEALLVDLFLDAHAAPRSRSRSTWTPPTIRCTASRKAGSSTVITIAIATCRFTSSAGGTCWRRSCGRPTSMPRRARARRSPASCAASAPAGRACASCCAPTAASAATR